MMSSNKMTQEDLESLFENSYTTIFCSHNKDGTIHAAPIWYRYKDGVFFFVSIKKSKRVANLKQNNTVSLSFLEQGTKAGEEGDVPSKCALVYGKTEMRFELEGGYGAFAKWARAPLGSDHNPEFDHQNFVTV